MWSLNTIMGAGALGVEVTISGKLRTERAHFEKHTIGIVPKSGEISDKIVRTGISHVLTKMGLMGIQLRIASKAALPQEFEFKEESTDIQTSAQPAASESGSEMGQSSKGEESTMTEGEKGAKQHAQT